MSSKWCSLRTAMTTLTLFVTWAHSHLLAPQAALGQRWKHHRQQNHQSIGQVNWPSKEGFTYFLLSGIIFHDIDFNPEKFHDV